MGSASSSSSEDRSPDGRGGLEGSRDREGWGEEPRATERSGGGGGTYPLEDGGGGMERVRGGVAGESL